MRYEDAYILGRFKVFSGRSEENENSGNRVSQIRIEPVTFQL
jgi:hypothetical protein